MWDHRMPCGHLRPLWIAVSLRVPEDALHRQCTERELHLTQNAVLCCSGAITGRQCIITWSPSLKLARHCLYAYCMSMMKLSRAAALLKVGRRPA